MLLFMGHGLLLGAVGIFVGAVLGVLLSLGIADLAAGIERVTGVQLFDPAVYYIGRLPSDLFWTDVLATTLLALLLSTLATLYPAWRASRIAPAEVLDNG